MSQAVRDLLLAYGLWSLAGTVILLGLFAVMRGRIRIEAGWGGWMLPRFGLGERLVHWVLALSFIVLALTGLESLYASRLPLQLLGTENLAAVRALNRSLHHQAAWPFMAALALAFLLWIRHSLPHWRDAIWLAMGGGLLVPRWHPAAWKFNAGQKLFFWAVMLCGLVLSLTGLGLLFPLETALFSKVFGLLNGLGMQVPANLTPDEEARHALFWHTASALGLACAALIHVYLRTFGIQGAVSAMAGGEADINWARQHHRLWAEAQEKRIEEEPAGEGAGAVAPAE